MKRRRVTLTPIDLSSATQTGKRTFRKQILKKGAINYKGEKIVFDDKFLMDLARSFKKRAYDQVPFVLADGANAHNMDPERFRGELKAVELTDDGLDGIFSLTADGAKVVKRNPRLGVSARIVQGIEHSDGRKFGRAIQHVLATMNPRVTGMKPWQAIDLSEEEEGEVVDLTAETFEEGSQMATKSKAKAKGQPKSGVVSVKGKETEANRQRALDLSKLDDEQFQKFLDLALADEDDEDEDDEDLDEDESDDEDDDDEVVDVTDEMDEDDDEDDEDDEDEEDDEEDEDETDLAIPDAFKKNIKGKKGKKTVEGKDAEPKGDVPLGEKVKADLQPKGRKKKAKVKEVAALSIDERVAQNEWKRERRRYARAGVPPHMLDLAEPVLSSPKALVIDLSNDEQVDASEIIRNLLDASEGYIEIKPEIGHQIDLSRDDEEGKPNPGADLLAAWDKEYGNA